MTFPTKARRISKSIMRILVTERMTFKPGRRVSREISKGLRCREDPRDRM